MHVKNLFVACVAVLLLIQAEPAHAVKLWDDWKVDRPQGPGWVFYATSLTGGRDDIGQDVFFVPTPGTGHTSAVQPSDLGLEIVFVANGHSGRQAKDKDKKELFLKMLLPGTTRWRVVDAQLEKEQNKLPREERWSGVLRARFRADELPYGVTTFKVDFPYDNDPPFILVNRVRRTLDQLMAVAAGATEGVLPDEASPMPVPARPAVEAPQTPPDRFDPNVYQREQEAEKEKAESARREQEAQAGRDRRDREEGGHQSRKAEEVERKRDRDADFRRDGGDRQLERRRGDMLEYHLTIPASVSWMTVVWLVDGKPIYLKEGREGLERTLFSERFPASSRVTIGFKESEEGDLLDFYRQCGQSRLRKGEPWPVDGVRSFVVEFVPAEGGRR